MKKILFLLFCLSLNSNILLAQCSCPISAGTKQYPPSITYTPTNNWKTIGSIWGGNYQIFKVQNGYTYTWSYCSSDGGSASWDTRLNLYNNNSGTFLSCNGDYCGLQSRLTWTANFTGEVRLITNTYHSSSNPCGTNSTNATIAYKTTGSPSLPDLTISNYPTTTPSQVKAGETVKVNYKVLNNGSGNAGSSYVSFHLSLKSYFDNTAMWVDDILISGISGNGSSGNLSKTITIPSTLAEGIYYVLVSADGTNKVAESSESNQTSYTILIVDKAVQSGSIEVTLKPQEAIDNGAQWRVDGGNWQNNGYTLSGLSVGNHNLEFKTINGFTTPPNKSFSVTANNKLTEIGDYKKIVLSPELQCNVSDIEFSNTCTSTTKTFNITNTGNADLIIQVPNNIPQYYNVGHYQTTNWNSPVLIAPNASLTFTVNFSPPSEGTYNGFFTLKSNASNSASYVIKVNGNCTQSGTLNLSTTLAPSSGYLGTSYTWEVEVIGNTNNNLSLDIIITNPITQEEQPYLMQKISPKRFSFTKKLDGLGVYSYKFRFSPSGNFSNTYSGPTNSIRPPTDDYPFKDQKSACQLTQNKGCTPDPWNSCKHNCTSWLMWKLNQASGDTDTTKQGNNINHPWHNWAFGYMGDAKNWDNSLKSDFNINNIPAIGAIAHWQPGDLGYTQMVGSNSESFNGHIAYVVAFDPISKDFEVTEYNVKNSIWNNKTLCSFSRRKLNMNKPISYNFFEAGIYNNPNSIPGRFIHVEGGKGGGADSTVSNIPNLRDEAFINLYPNPNNGIFTIQIFSNQEVEASLTILNMLGNRIKTEKIDLILGTNSKTFDISEIKNGMYIVYFQTNSTTITKRIVIQH